LAKIAASIIGKIDECRSVISKKRMKAVKGALVTPVRNAIIPNKVKRFVLGVFVRCAMKLPILPPAAKECSKYATIFYSVRVSSLLQVYTIYGGRWSSENA
jgi:hypothetical protein